MTFTTDMGASLVMPVTLSSENSTRHMAIVSNSQTLISDMAMSFIYQQIVNGGGLILVDTSLDQVLTSNTHMLMKDAGRLDQLKVVSFDKPDQSHTYNLLSSGCAETTLCTIMKDQDTGEFWTNVARISLMAVVLTLKLQPGSPNFSIKEVLVLLSDFDLLLSYAQNINSEESESHKCGAAFIQDYLSNWRADDGLDWNRKQHKTLMMGLVSKLAGLSMSEYGNIVNTCTPDVELKHSIQDNSVVILSWPGHSHDNTLIGSLFVDDLIRAIGDLLLESKLPALFPVIFTQYPTYISENQASLFSLARAANMPLIVGVQGQGAWGNISSSHVESLLSNCGTRIYGKLMAESTIAFASRIEAMAGVHDMAEALSSLTRGQGLLVTTEGARNIDLPGSSKHDTCGAINPKGNADRDLAARLHEIAYRDTATKVTVAAEDLRQLLAIASRAGIPGASPDCDDAFADHFETDPADPSCSHDVAVWRSAWEASRRALPTDAEQHIQLLGQLLGECIVTAGITRPDAPLSGPELLMFGNDLKTHLAQLIQGEEAFNAVIGFVLANRSESPLEFLQCWNEGDFEALRKEWPEAPEEIYIGPDTQHPKTIGYGNDLPAAAQPLAVIRLLSKCRDSLTDGLESQGVGEAEFSINDRALIAEVDAFLAGHAGAKGEASVVQGMGGDAQD